MNDEERPPRRQSLLTHALLKGAVSDDDEDEVEDEEELKQQKRIEDMDENYQPEYSMKEIKTVLEEAEEDIELGVGGVADRE